MQIQFDPRAVETFADAGSVYHTLTLGDAWGMLHVAGGDALIARDFASVTLSVTGIPSGSTVNGRGWSLQLTEGERIVADPSHDGHSRSRVRRGIAASGRVTQVT